MSDINASIQDAAATNASLLATLSETDYAPPQLKEQERYIAELEKSLKETNSKLERRLKTETQMRKEDSEKYQSSIMKRFAYKATGQGEKFDDKASTEERKYMEAVEEERRATALKESLDSKLTEARAAQEQLDPVAKKHADAQTQLDSLYEKIFSGPTPSFPEEDQKEDVVKNSLYKYQDVQAKLDAERRVVKLLVDARWYCNDAENEASNARDASRMDLFGGGMLMDMMERSALGKAEKQVDQFKSLYNQAQQTSPFVKSLSDVKMADGHMWSDMVFDTIGGDLRMHDNIKESQAQLEKAKAIIDEQTQEARGRVKDLEGQVEKAASELEAARKELQAARTKAIDQVTKGGTST